MFFSVLQRGAPVPGNSVSQAFLRIDRWDDWGKYRTLFQLIVFDENGVAHEAGDVKIGHFGLAPGAAIGPNVRAPALEDEFDRLPDSYFSLGQRETYYETLNELSFALRNAVLEGLNDCALNLDLFSRAMDEYVMTESLLRDVSIANVRNRFHRLAIGDAALTAFEFEYAFPETDDGTTPPVLTFVVTPSSTPPTNIHVLIGRNGVGKTRCMQNIARSLLEGEESIIASGIVQPTGTNEENWSFASLISVAFSAFDDFDLPRSDAARISAHSIGLRYIDSDSDEIVIKTPSQLEDDFTNSFRNCRTGLKSQRWQNAVETLSNDPLFAEAEIASLLVLDENDWTELARGMFRRLSSGHKIVLLTVTRLVELTDERTLVLLDEPEGHLHPPLLSAFIRTLANLLIQRNGVAIVATHSPVVLQEVPRSSVWVLHRSGVLSTAERPLIETFGENVGVLTREIFGLEVTTAGFHQLLKDVIERGELTYDEVLDHFGEQLGAEGRAIARALVLDRNSND